MRRSKLRSVSKRRRDREAEARPFRLALIAKEGQCSLCMASPKKPNRHLPTECSRLCVHEIANGPLRQKALDQPYAVLVLCWQCNQDIHGWPEPRQLAVLQRVAPDRYDLTAYNHLVNPNAPNRITQAEVDAWSAETVAGRKKTVR